MSYILGFKYDTNVLGNVFILSESFELRTEVTSGNGTQFKAEAITCKGTIHADMQSVGRGFDRAT